jgi:predicted HTH domain antitoxin
VKNELNLNLPPEVSASEARLALAVKLVELDRLSTGQGAILAGLSKSAFLEMMGKLGVPVFAYPPEELDRELGT